MSKQTQTKTVYRHSGDGRFIKKTDAEKLPKENWEKERVNTGKK